jgi:uroporphyrinogen decarboxylase
MEVFTLDSASCAACGYMVSAAQRAAEELTGQVDWVEYKFTTLENIARMQKLGVKNLPSIYLNGELKFSSIIPGNKELLEAIKDIL